MPERLWGTERREMGYREHREHPRTVPDLRLPPAYGGGVFTWWTGMSKAEQQAVIARHRGRVSGVK